MVGIGTWRETLDQVEHWKARAERAETALVGRHGGNPVALLAEMEDLRVRVRAVEELALAWSRNTGNKAAVLHSVAGQILTALKESKR